ncbi:hypothetical protein KO500_11795 [Cellulophaga baltica]|nr:MULTISPECIES: hypothetical protein [Cellulophaga]MBU2997122.1 hypothetical protein [Cellulophaga baltica]MDO6768520.1 hypothetical protein [Cellulophaga sp. 1_MG-2023]
MALLKSKYVIKSKQIPYVIIGGVLASALLFVIGYYVGKLLFQLGF